MANVRNFEVISDKVMLFESVPADIRTKMGLVNYNKFDLIIGWLTI
jgi:hypothetical protein